MFLPNCTEKKAHETSILHSHTHKENTQLRKLDQERWSVPEKSMQNVCPFPNGQSWKQTSSIKLTQPFLYKNMCVYPNTYICNINS